MSASSFTDHLNKNIPYNRRHPMRNNLTNRLILTLAVTIWAIGPSALLADDAPPPGFDRSHAGTLVPDAPFVDENGMPHQLSDFRGHILLLTFWATWCHGCVVELPALARLQADIGATVTVIPIIHDKEGGRAARAYFTKHDLANLPAFSEIDQTHPLATAFGQQWLPTAIVIDANGREIARAVGALDWDDATVRRVFQPAVHSSASAAVSGLANKNP